MNGMQIIQTMLYTALRSLLGFIQMKNIGMEHVFGFPPLSVDELY